MTAGQSSATLQKLRQFAIDGQKTGQRVIVYIKSRVVVIFPNKEAEVGSMR
jgi:hypothetical protein